MNKNATPIANNPHPATAEPAPTRLLSLDAFRGLVIVVMFLVNVGGTDEAFRLGAWAPAQYRTWMPHMGWNGGRMGNGLADYVFPWFLFIVGAAIPFSMNSGRGRGRAWWMHMLHALRRGMVIYLLGSLMWAATIGYRPEDTGATWAGPIDWRIFLHWDILPLIGLGYFVGVTLYHTPRWAQIIFVAVVLVLKWYLLKGATPPECDGWVDALEKHQSLHQTLGPRLGIPGWWSTLITQGTAFSIIVVIGSLVGEMVRVGRIGSANAAGPDRVTLRLGVVGAALSIAAIGWWLLADFPFSKDFVSPTYILITSGTGTLVLAGMLWIVDVKRWSQLTWLRVYGTNALSAYVLAEFLWKTVLTRWHVVLPPSFQPATLAAGSKPESAWAITAFKAWLQEGFGNPLGAYLVIALYIGAYWAVCFVLFQRKLFIKV